MAMKNAAQGHTIVDEEEATVAMNWQSGDSNNSGSYESPEDKLDSLLLKRGA
jgi:hypothetical protein